MQLQCAKCGAINGGNSKHHWAVVRGKKFCGRCGSIKLTPKV